MSVLGISACSSPPGRSDLDHFRDPTEAILIAADSTVTLFLAVTEVMVPGFNGSILAECLAAIRPNYISGCADDKTVQLGVPGQACAFVVKRFWRDDLIWKVCELLNSRTEQAS